MANSNIKQVLCKSSLDRGVGTKFKHIRFFTYIQIQEQDNRTGSSITRALYNIKKALHSTF